MALPKIGDRVIVPGDPQNEERFGTILDVITFEESGDATFELKWEDDDEPWLYELTDFAPQGTIWIFRVVKE